MLRPRGAMNMPPYLTARHIPKRLHAHSRQTRLRPETGKTNEKRPVSTAPSPAMSPFPSTMLPFRPPGDDLFPLAVC